MPLSVVDLYQKVLPKTNCKDCGFPTCLAFASMVVSEKLPLKNCPHLAPDVVEEYQPELDNQHAAGKWTKKDMAQEAVPNRMGGNSKDFIMERKENRAMLGQQVINNGMANQAMAKARHASAKKRPPVAMTPGMNQHNTGRNTQGAWANGQLPVAMQQ